MHLWRTGAAVAMLTLSLAACGSGSSGGGKVSAGSGTSPSASASASASSMQDTIAGLTANDHGTKNVAGMSTFTIQADNYYFNPSVLKGTAGQKLTLVIENVSDTQHNFSVDAQHLNKDLSGMAKVTTNVTFPKSGVLSFYCSYHKANGMAGGLLTSGDKAAAGASTTSSSSGGGTVGWG